MYKLLKTTGPSKEVLDLVGPIVDSGRVCRTWAKPVASIASSRLITVFNEEVEGDVVFVKYQGTQKKFLHLVDS